MVVWKNREKISLECPASSEKSGKGSIFTELDAMQVVERTTKRLTIELPGFSLSFSHKEGDICSLLSKLHITFIQKNSAKIFQNLLLKIFFLSIICIGK